MKRSVMMLVCTAMVSALSYAGRYQIVVQKVGGEVMVRHGVAEEWTSAKAGETLKPDDTMKTGVHGTAVIVASEEGLETKTLSLPSEVIVDLSDVRNLTPEELMLKLTMEKVRASSYHWKNTEMHFPTTTIVHGPDQRPETPLSGDLKEGQFELNGSRVLFDNGFFSTCALRALDVLRRHPLLAANVENRMMVAEALEKAHLRGEAINEYTSILQMDLLRQEQQDLVKKRIELLRESRER